MRARNAKLPVLGYGLFLVVLVGLFEIAAAFVVARTPGIYIQTGADLVAGLNDTWIERFYDTTFDPELGWQPQPDAHGAATNSAGRPWTWSTDQTGARANALLPNGREPDLAAFGDSFTFGAEVNDDMTWPYQLAHILGRPVANYGVNGYGTAQAFLRFRQKLAQGIRPRRYVILGIFEDNAQRMLTGFRPFVFPATRLHLGFKPRAYLEPSGRIAFKPPALQTEVRDRVALAALIDAARIGDPWAELRPTAAFPYALNLFRAARFGACTAGRHVPICAGLPEVDWRAGGVQALMTALIARFRDTARDHNIRPVVLFISFKQTPPYRDYLDRLRQSHGDEVLIIDTSEAEFDPTRLTVRPDGGHLSSYGNEIVARHIAAHLTFDNE